MNNKTISFSFSEQGILINQTYWKDKSPVDDTKVPVKTQIFIPNEDMLRLQKFFNRRQELLDELASLGERI